MRRVLRWFLQLLLLPAEIMLVSLLLLVFGGFLLGTSNGRETLMGLAVTQLRWWTPFDVTAAELRSPAFGHWQIGQLTLAWQNQPLLQLEALNLEIDWWAIERGEWRIADLSARRLWLEGDGEAWPVRPSPDPDRTAEPEPLSPSLQAWLDQWRARLDQLQIDRLIIVHPAVPEAVPLTVGLKGLSGAQLGTWPPSFAVERLQLATLDGRQRIEARHGPEGLEGLVRLQAFPLSLLALVLDDFNTGTVSADLRIEGPLTRPRASGAVRIETRFLDLPLQAGAQLAWQGLTLGFEDFSGSWDRLTATGRGRLDFDSMTMAIEVTQAQAPIAFASGFGATLPPALQLEATVREGTVEGPLTRPVYHAPVTATGRYHQLPFTVQGTVTGGVEALTRVVARVRAGQGDLPAEASLEGHLAFSGNYQVEGHYRQLTLDTLKAAGVSLPAFPEERLALTSSGSLESAGSFTRPTFKLDSQNTVEWDQHRHQLTLVGRGDLAGAHIQELSWWSPQRLPSEEPALVMAGDLNWQRDRVALEVKSHGLQLDELRRLPLEAVPGLRVPELPGLVTAAIDGEVQLDGALTRPDVRWLAAIAGHVEIPENGFDATTEADANGGARAPFRITSDGQYRAGQIALRQAEFWVDGRRQLALEGVYQAGDQPLLSTRASFDQFHLRPLKRMWRALQGLEPPTTDSPNEALQSWSEGTLQGHLALDLHQQLTLDGRLQYAFEWPLRGEDQDLTELPLLATLDLATLEGASGDEQAQLQLALTEPARELLRVEAGVLLEPYRALAGDLLAGRLPEALPLAVQAEGSLDIATLKAFYHSDLEDFGGRVTVQAEASGTSAAPQLSGQLTLRDGRYENQLVGTRLQDVRADLALAGSRVEVREVQLRTPEQGSLTLTGYMDLVAPGNVDLRLRADRALLVQRPDLEAAANGQLTLQGDRDGLLLSGDIQLQPLTLRINTAFARGIPEIEVREVSAAPEARRAGAQARAKASSLPLRFDLAVRADQQAFVRGRGVFAELKGLVQLTGTASEPRYGGNFQVIRGYIDLFTKRFMLDRGIVAFQGNTVLLDLSGVHEARDETFRLGLSGSIDDFRLTLESDPPLPQDEVLSRLLFGKSVGSITPLQGLQLAAAVQTLQGGNSVIPDPLETARQLVGVDQLTIESSNDGEQKGVSVGVGKYVSEDVYIEFERTPDPSQPWQGRVNIELSPRLNLETSSGANGETAVELLWKRNY